MMQSAAILCGLLATSSLASPVGNRAARAVCEVEVEAESSSSSGWARGSAIGGASDSAYLTWTGGNHFASSQAGKFGLLSYKVNVPTTGTYKLSIRNIHGHDDPTEGNDAWVRVGTSSPWLKVFNNVVDKWNYVTFIDPGHGCSWNGLPDCEHPSYTLQAGQNTVQVSGRSKDFTIDTIKLELVGQGCSATSPAPAPAVPAPAPAVTPAPSPPAPGPPAVSGAGFEALNAGGVGCCRFDDSNENSGADNYRSLPAITDWETCQAECKADAKCLGYELSEWEGCEIHWAVPSHATSTDGCTCMKKTSEPDAPVVTDAPTEAPATDAPTTVVDVTTATEAPSPVLPGTLSAEAMALAPAAGSCAFLPGYDFAGSDFADFGNVQTVEQCAEMCLADPACEFFTRTKWNTCHLKSMEAGYNAPVQAGKVNVWGDTGRCLRAPTTGDVVSATTAPASTAESQVSEPAVTEAPATDAPATDAPATDAPTTDAPTTDAPATDAPATDAPATTVAAQVSEPAVDEMVAMAAALAAALEASASIQAENGALAAENEQLHGTIDAIKALLE